MTQCESGKISSTCKKEGMFLNDSISISTKDKCRSSCTIFQRLTSSVSETHIHQLSFLMSFFFKVSIASVMGMGLK